MAAAKSKPNEIRLIRTYDAPLKAVWDAWVDPAQAAHWWGPRGFTLTSHSKDLRAGGTWVYTMHGPDGVDWPNTHLYHAVEPLKKLVYDHGAIGKPPLFHVTVLFWESDGKTTMDMTMALPTAEAAENTRTFIKKVGGNSTWDRLAEYLEKSKSGKDEFVINRSFDAPLELMFDLWTKPEHFSRWLPPTGFEMQFIRCEMREGGSSFYVMSGGNGMKMYGRCQYLEIRKPDRIVYTQQFVDEKENISRHPMLKTWPETMLTSVTLAAEDGGGTRVTVQWEPYGAATAEEVEAFMKMRGGMAQGWTGSFDKLEEYLANQ